MVGGVWIFAPAAIRVVDAAAPLGLTPREVDDYRAFFDDVSQLRDITASPRSAERRVGKSADPGGRPIIKKKGSPAWRDGGIKAFAAPPVRQLRAAAVSAHRALA